MAKDFVDAITQLARDLDEIDRARKQGKVVIPSTKNTPQKPLCKDNKPNDSTNKKAPNVDVQTVTVKKSQPKSQFDDTKKRQKDGQRSKGEGNSNDGSKSASKKEGETKINHEDLNLERPLKKEANEQKENRKVTMLINNTNNSTMLTDSMLDDSQNKDRVEEDVQYWSVDEAYKLLMAKGFDTIDAMIHSRLLGSVPRHEPMFLLSIDNKPLGVLLRFDVGCTSKIINSYTNVVTGEQSTVTRTVMTPINMREFSNLCYKKLNENSNVKRLFNKLFNRQTDEIKPLDNFVKEILQHNIRMLKGLQQANVSVDVEFFNHKYLKK